MLRRLMTKENGNVTVLVSVLLFAFMGIMAIVIDVGVVFAEKAKLSKAIDAAILAGGQELPENIDKAIATMEEYLIENGVTLDQVEISIDEDGFGAEIVATKPVDHYFAKVIGFDSTNINEQARIIVGPSGSATGGLRPFGVEKYDFVYGDPVVLKEGAGDGYHGNYGAVALGGSGSSVLLDNALYGYDGIIEVGDIIYTEPGNMMGAVNTIAAYINSFDESFDSYTRGSDRVWTVPLVDTMVVSGREGVVVVGFAQFFVEDVKKIAGEAQMFGRFIRYVTNGDIDYTIDDTGSYSMKLVD